MQDQSTGFLYVAFGNRHTMEAIISAQSLRKACPKGTIAVVTDQSVSDPVFDQVIQDVAPEMTKTGNFHVKIAGLRKTPFERTIFIDTDTLICGDLSSTFALLDRFDLVVTHNAWRVDRAFEENAKPYSEVPLDFMTFNTGFLAFASRPVIDDLLQAWAERMTQQIVEHSETNDQPAFRWALYQSAVRFVVLSNAHNYHAHNPFMLPGYQKLMVLHDRRPLMQWYANVINADPSPRPRVVGYISPRLIAAFYIYASAGFVRRAWRKLKSLFIGKP